MQSIMQSYNSDSANTSGRSSAMSISSTVSTIASTHPDSPTLPRLEPPSPVPSTRTFGSPTPKKLAFGTAEYIEPIRLRPVTCEDADSEDEDFPLLSSTDTTAAYPSKVSIKVEHFESVHNARETEAKQSPPIPDNTTKNTTTTTTDDQPLTDAEAAAALIAIGATAVFKEATPRQSHCSRQIDWLRRILANQPDADDTITVSSHSLGWDHDDESELEHLWPKPPMTPPEGDDMHPPQMNVCGVHPGQGWELNDPLTKNYYRFLIPDPSTKRLVVAPFVTHSFADRGAPMISGTYGQGYPIHTRPLTPTPTNYINPIITPEQLRLLDTREPFADAINHVVNEYFPLDLSAAVRQYQYFRETEYAIQRTIRNLQEKEMRYVEKAVSVLSDLENANVLGRLLAHAPEIEDRLFDAPWHGKPFRDHNPVTPFLTLAESFKGTITQSALDVRPNKYVGKHADRPSLHHEDDDAAQAFIDSKIEGMEDRLRARLHAPKRTKAAARMKPMWKHKHLPGMPGRSIKVCYECAKPGHIRVHCPLLSPLRK